MFKNFFRSSSSFVLLATILFTVAAVLTVNARPTPEPDIKALLITGGCCHDYDTQRELIPAAIDLHTSLRVQWTIVHQRTTAGDILLDFYKNPNWADGYDVVVHNECFAHISDDDYIAGILQPHIDGMPAVLIHCSMHSYREGTNAQDWYEFCGVHTARHGPQHPFEVQITESDHEVTIGMENWTTPRGELYFIKTVFPNTTVLAKSRSEVDGVMHPNIWVSDYGPNKTRVFATTIGHHNETMMEANYMKMLTRGFLWAAGKPVQANLSDK